MITFGIVNPEDYPEHAAVIQIDTTPDDRKIPVPPALLVHQPPINRTLVLADSE